MARALVFVLDSAGVGALPDAAVYSDAPGANTIGNVAARTGGLHIPNLASFGLGNLTTISGVSSVGKPRGSALRLAARSRGKDTITGHWEMAGIITDQPFPLFPNGFPKDVVDEFTTITRVPPLGNIAASGTEIIAHLGDEHLRTGRPILYTSADSVFQVAAHESVVPLATLYDWCERARDMLTGLHAVNRVIARPFIGTSGAFVRTANRRDYAIEPPEGLLDRLAGAQIPVYAVGKIADIYCGHGITSSVRVADNHEAVDRTLDLIANHEHGMIFVNLNDFDTKFGHRRDVRGYAEALERFDGRLNEIFAAVGPEDMVAFTADHGCDPTAPGSDHTREYVPYLEIGPASPRKYLGDICGLDHVGRRVETFLLGAKA